MFRHFGTNTVWKLFPELTSDDAWRHGTKQGGCHNFRVSLSAVWRSQELYVTSHWRDRPTDRYFIAGRNRHAQASRRTPHILIRYPQNLHAPYRHYVTILLRFGHRKWTRLQCFMTTTVLWLFRVLTAVTINVTVFRDVTPCNFVFYSFSSIPSSLFAIGVQVCVYGERLATRAICQALTVTSCSVFAQHIYSSLEIWDLDLT
jgi:hypothetical protein